MKAKVFVPGHIAAQSNRLSQQQIDIAMTDTINDVKIKITLVYTQLDPQRFYLMINWDRLMNQNITVLQLTQKYGDKLEFKVTTDVGCCIIY